ncbi:MAG: hypothetical protein QOD86_1759 [Miltoncostaeaceae bacterium]|jgi:uncharacterized membrane protein|nr:hypothetical protein [Miltoncostaeaceae bacterium]
MTTLIEDRLLAAEHRLELARAELAALRAELLPARGAPPAPEPRPAAPPRAPRPVRPAGRPRPERPSALEGLMGPRLVAWAGGVTVLLGIAFLFAMAVHRGWVGEGLRVAIGGAVSAGLVGAAALLRRRVGGAPVVAVAAGAGFAGAFVSLAAATARYDLMPGWMGSLATELVAAGAVALALAWGMQSAAALGLVGAIACAPVMAGGITPGSLGFALVAFGAACGLQRASRWTPTMLLGAAAIAPQAVWLALAHDPVTPWATASVVAGVALAATRGAAERQRAAGDGAGLSGAALAALLAGAVVAAAGTIRLTAGAGIAAAPLLPAAAYLAWAGWLTLRGRDRTLRGALGAAGLAFLGAGLLTGLDGAARAAVPAALGLAALWAGPRVGEPRLRWAAAWLGGVAALGALAAASPGDLAEPGAAGWPAVGAVAVVAGALLAAARVARDPRERRVAAWAALAAGAYGAALAILRLAGALIAEPELAFQRGHAAVSAAAVIAGLAAVAAWAWRAAPRPALQAGLVLLAAGLAKAFVFDLANLEALERALAFMAVGAALLAAGALLAWRRTRRGEAPA